MYILYKVQKYRLSFVLISSIASVIGRLGVTAYAASKGAMVAAVKPMALELAAKEMTVNCVSLVRF